MKEKLKKQEVDFTQVKNKVLNDKNLSLKAKGLFAYLYSKPNDWDFSGKRIANEIKESKTAIYSGIEELENNNYLQRKKLHNGRMEYYITYSQKPVPQNGELDTEPVPQNPKEVKPQRGKTGSISNIDNKVIYNNTNISCDENIAGKELNELIDKFQYINPSWERLFSNKTQREALSRMVKKHGYEKMSNLIDGLPKIVERQYAPNISTPYELEQKFGKLLNFIKKQRSTNQIGIAI